jgi:hypothetical protein
VNSLAAGLTEHYRERNVLSEIREPPEEKIACGLPLRRDLGSSELPGRHDVSKNYGLEENGTSENSA